MNRIVKTYHSTVQIFHDMYALYDDIYGLGEDIKILVHHYQWHLIIMVSCTVMPVLHQLIQRNPEVANEMGMFSFFFWKRFSVEVTIDKFNSTFTPLPIYDGKGNRIFFTFVAWLLQQR